jgi:hypothetical protein
MIVGEGAGAGALTANGATRARSLIWKLESVFGKGIAKDAGNPSGTLFFTISTALGNERRKENQHEDDEARS